MKSNMLIVLAALLLFGQTACSLIERPSASRAVPSVLSATDSDGDFVSDEVERQIGTNPRSRDYDTDNDGVPNYLEYNGYTYDWKTGKFAPWDGNPAVRHWRTDPTQWSTDQDAFPDGMEVSGALMDVTVQEPGDDPLVPAYPDIVIRLESYAVTLNEDISYTDGGSLAKGSTWNRETAQTSSRSTERAWEVGTSVTGTFKWGGSPIAFAGGELAITVSGKYGETYTSTQTTSTAVSVGNSVLDESNWSRARTSNPTTAAQLKLRLKVHNYGTACASNIIPTLTLRIGGINVATFEPGNAQINMLPPGGQYPPDRGVYWVVDSIDTGVGVTPLYLTLDELRALERGAPVSLTVTQLKADVMLKDRSGKWTNAGDCSEYLARCEAVGANIQIEIGDGSFVHHLVYADDAPSAPPVTLGDALTSLGVGANGQFHYQDTKGIAQVASIEGYGFVFDQETLRRNGWGTNEQPANMADMVLGPGTSVLIRSPRKSLEEGPTIYYANADPRTRVVQACVSDYDGISNVKFVVKEGADSTDANDPKSADINDLRLEMHEDIPGSGFFSIEVPLSHYVFDGTEQVVATNLAGQDSNQPVEIVYYEPTPRPEKPVFNTVFMYYQEGKPKVYANVTNPRPEFPIQWVKAFYDSPIAGGEVEMGPPPNYYEDPYGYINKTKLPDGLSSVKVVAFVTGGVYQEQIVSIPTREVKCEGTVELQTRFDWTGTNEWQTNAFDLDADKGAYAGWYNNPQKFSGPYEFTYWCAAGGKNPWRLYFNVPYAKIKNKKFDSIDAFDIDRELSDESMIQKEKDSSLEDVIFVLKTDEGRCAKLKIEKWYSIKNTSPEQHSSRIKVRYCVYKLPSEGVPVDPKNPPPVLQLIGDKSVDENVNLKFSINATDPKDEPITYSARNLPSGATFTNKIFNWTPSYTQVGSYQITFIASDGNSHVSETITITVNDVDRAPILGGKR